MIAAVDKNMAIGGPLGIPWYLPEDLKRFKHFTSHQTVLMGRKTFDFIGRPLVNRKCLVLTKNPKWRLPIGNEFSKTHIISNVLQAIDLCDSETMWVIGGAEIYSLMMPVTSTIELTELNTEMPRKEITAWFPGIPPEFNVTSREKHQGPQFSFEYVRYDRSQKEG